MRAGRWCIRRRVVWRAARCMDAMVRNMSTQQPYHRRELSNQPGVSVCFSLPGLQAVQIYLLLSRTSCFIPVLSTSSQHCPKPSASLLSPTSQLSMSPSEANCPFSLLFLFFFSLTAGKSLIERREKRKNTATQREFENLRILAAKKKVG